MSTWQGLYVPASTYFIGRRSKGATKPLGLRGKIGVESTGVLTSRATERLGGSDNRLQAAGWGWGEGRVKDFMWGETVTCHNVHSGR